MDLGYKMMLSQKQIPDKLFFKIGEVSDIAGVPAHVLRFWETEFRRIKPRRTESGQRLYRRQDVELLLYIKHLLHEKKFTIKGAKRYLRSHDDPVPEKATRTVLEEIRAELKDIRDLLD